MKPIGKLAGIMPRIGRQIKHHASVDQSTISAHFSPDRRHRYRLSLQYVETLTEQRTQTMTVVMKNPSSADEQAADKTNYNLQASIHAAFPEVKTLHVTNLFGLRATDASEVKAALMAEGLEPVVGPDNDLVIAAAIQEADKVLIAWGGASGIPKRFYDVRIAQVQALLEGIDKPIYRSILKGSPHYPHHPCFWPIPPQFKRVESVPSTLA